MSDYVSPSRFQVLWDGLMSDIPSGDDTNTAQNVDEISYEDFESKFGIDPRIFDDESWLDDESTGMSDTVTVEANVDQEPTATCLNVDPEPIATSSNVDPEPIATAIVPDPTDITEPTATRFDIPEIVDKIPEKENEFRVVGSEDVHQFILNQENKNTSRKTLKDINKFQRYLALKGEKREFHKIEVEVLDDLVASFILSLKKQDGSDYEPTTLRGILSSIDRKLRRHKYPHTIMSGSGPQFSLTRETYNAKKRSLKKQGKGNRPNEAEPITDEEIDGLWQKGILGGDDPNALINTLWLNNSIHFGMRGTTEQYSLRWGDVRLRATSDGTEFLELNERETKTRTGENLADIRRVAPKMFATNNNRDPIALYKLYADKRPQNFSDNDHPFYLAPNTKYMKPSSAGVQSGPWFIRQKIGMNKLSKMLKNMAKMGDLPEDKKITNHSARKHLVQKLRENDVPPTEIMAMTGHKNIQSILNYSNITEIQQKKCSNLLSNSISVKSAGQVGAFPPSNSSAEPGPITTVTARPADNNAAVPLQNVTMPNFSPHPQQNMQNFQQLSNSFTSQFFGATFNIQNFNLQN